MLRDNPISAAHLEQLMKTNPWWKEVSDEFDRVYMVHQLSKVVSIEQKSEAVEAMFEYLLISEEDLQRAESHPTYKEARALIESLNNGDQFPARLIELYESRIPEAINRINETATQLICQLSSLPFRAEVKQLLANDGHLLESVDLSNLSPPLNAGTADDRYILRCILELQRFDKLLRHSDTYPFWSKTYTAAKVGMTENENMRIAFGPGKERVRYLAYRAYNPLWDIDMERFELEYVTFRLKWAGSVLSSQTLSRLYKQHKTGQDVVAEFIVRYQNKETLDRLENAISSCPVTQPHGALFKEAVQSFNTGQYRVCSTAVLPIIEGLIWEFAWWWNRENGGLFDRSISRSEYKDVSRFQLLRKDGTNVKGRPNVGKLLRQTSFGEEVYFEIVEYLVIELFEERNPVLHGREPDYGSRRQAAALIFVVETLERAITKWLMKQMGKTLINSLKRSQSTEEERLTV